MNRFLAVLALVVLAACSGDAVPVVGPTELQIQDTVVGTGATAATGDTVTVHYIGAFINGNTFESSYGGDPFTFRIGAGTVIAGWEQGVPGMKVGGKRRLTIPASLAYGSRSVGRIPPNTPLRFDIELIAIAGR